MKIKTICCIFLFMLSISAKAEGVLPTAQDLIVAVEVGSEHCLQQSLLTEDDRTQIRQFVRGLLKLRTYEEYMASEKYETAKLKFGGGLPKNTKDTAEFCKALKRMPRTNPNAVMFFEPPR